MQLQATSFQEEVKEEVKDEVKAEEEPEPQLMQVDPTKAAPKTPSKENESDQNWVPSTTLKNGAMREMQHGAMILRLLMLRVREVISLRDGLVRNAQV